MSVPMRISDLSKERYFSGRIKLTAVKVAGKKNCGDHGYNSCGRAATCGYQRDTLRHTSSSTR
jgi:hypothetical protein